MVALVLLTYPTPAVADQQRLFALVNGFVNQRVMSTLLEATIVDGRVVSVVSASPFQAGPPIARTTCQPVLA